MNNPFSNPAFSMAALTAAINILPNRYGRLEELNLMPPKPVRQRQIVVEEMNGVLNLLPTLPPGSPGTVGVRGKRKLRSFVVPHIPHDDVVLPEEVQGIRAFGSETETETVAGVVARHLETMRNKHAITLEHLRVGALKGVILDADGSVLYDLFDAFEIAQQTVAFELGTAGTNVKAKCTTVLATIEENLKGEFMNGVHCLCSAEFFAALTGHAKVEKAFENWQNGAILINDVRRGFTTAESPSRSTGARPPMPVAPPAASSPPVRPTLSRWAPSTPSAPTSHRRTSTRPSTRWASRCTPSRSRASSTGAPTCTRSPTRCRCAIAPACWSS